MRRVIFFTICIILIGANYTSGQSSKPISNEIDSTQNSVMKKIKNEDNKIESVERTMVSSNKSSFAFDVANYSIAILTIVFALFTVVSVFFYYKERKDKKNIELIKEYKNEIEKVKKDFKKLKKILNQKVDFNYIAAETNLQSMEFISQMMLMQNPDLDKDKKFLKQISANKAILYLYHNDREARIRALQELQYYGTSSCIKPLKKYREEVNNKELSELADKTIAEIYKREGAKEILQKQSQNDKLGT